MANVVIDDDFVLELNMEVSPKNFDLAMSFYGLVVDPDCLYKEVFGRSEDGRLLVFNPVHDFGEFVLVTEEEYVRDGAEFLKWYAKTMSLDSIIPPNGHQLTLDELNECYKKMYAVGDKAAAELDC